jgi:SAM-dependent methyltransferase
MPLLSSAKWPKLLAPLTPEQQRISDDFMKRWHEELESRNRYTLVEKFNHGFPVKYSRFGFKSTLEIGAGLGEHIHYEKLTPEQEQNYYANELRENMAAAIQIKFPRVKTVVCDCQERFDFADRFFDRIIAVHVMEHLPNLPAAIREAYRLLNRQRGQLLVVIPCEGGPIYSLARKFSAERLYKKYYGGSYQWFYTREHINRPHEILTELQPYFILERRKFFPLPFLPFVFNNLVLGLSLVPRPRLLVDPGA